MSIEYGTRTVRTTGGPVVGFRRSEGSWAFRGIPYAQAPVGELRFRPPRPPEPWTTPRDATVFGPTCYQHEPAFRGEDFNYRALVSLGWRPGDDVLNLNVTTPDPDAAGLPVMVFVHGGAFNHGNGALPLYEGHRLAARGVVYISINYRVGAEGFLHLDDGGTNLGLRDQVAALAWVRDNVAAFGGDPGNVTVFGESAGAMSIALLLVSPAARGLFHRAVVQSGSGPEAIPAATAAETAAGVAAVLGVRPRREEVGRSTPAELLAATEAYAATRGGGLPGEGPLVTWPAEDGDVVPFDVRGALARGEGAPVPVVWGFNAEEANLFLLGSGRLDGATWADVDAAFAATHHDPGRARVALTALAGPGATPGQVLSRHLTWSMFAASTIRAALDHAAAGHPSWLYELTYRSGAAGGRVGAAHLTELPFVFDILDDPHVPAMLGPAAPQGLAAEMSTAWVAFAASGDPGWPRLADADGPSKLFDARSDVVRGRYPAVLHAWEHGRAD